MTRLNVICGNDFQIEAFGLESVEDVRILSAAMGESNSRRVKEQLTYFIMGSIILALLIATMIGLYRGSFEPVGLVWNAAALPLGCILKAHFDKQVPP